MSFHHFSGLGETPKKLPCGEDSKSTDCVIFFATHMCAKKVDKYLLKHLKAKVHEVLLHGGGGGGGIYTLVFIWSLAILAQLFCWV